MNSSMEIEAGQQAATGYQQLSEEQMWGVVIARKYYQTSFPEICEMFKINSQRTAQRVMERYNQREHPNKKETKVREKKKITEESKDRVTEIFQQNPHMSSRKCQKTLNDNSGNPICISYRSICTILKEKEFKYGNAVYKQKLTDKQKENRLKYCLEYCNYDFQHVYFSDESIFSLDQGTGKIWYKKNCVPDRTIQYSNMNTKDASVHVWGAVSITNRSQLYVFNTSVTKEAYVACLTNALLPVFSSKRRHRKLVQDGAPSHTAKLTMTFLEDNHIEVLPHPSRSPDLNPIEMVWAEMKRGFNENITKITSKEELAQTVIELWNKLPQENIAAYINNIKNVMNEVVENKGDFSSF